MMSLSAIGGIKETIGVRKLAHIVAFVELVERLLELLQS